MSLKRPILIEKKNQSASGICFFRMGKEMCREVEG